MIDSASIRLSWTAPVGGANGYIVVYNNVATDVSSTETVLSGLSTATVYDITVYGYKDIPSVASDTVSIVLDGELMYTNNDSTHLVAVQVSCDVSVTTVTSTMFFATPTDDESCIPGIYNISYMYIVYMLCPLHLLQVIVIQWLV